MIAPAALPGAMGAADEIVHLNARLRLACDALGVDPEDVRLSDLLPVEQRRLLAAGEGDFWNWLHRGSP